MKKYEHFKFSNGVIAYPLAFVLLLWYVFWFEIETHIFFNSHGIYPRTLSGLQGVIFSPFIHSGISHLYHNSIPLFVLSVALFYFYRPIAWKVLGYGILVSGFLTWCIGRPSYHIGASGLIYVLVSFIFFKGVFAKHYRLVALSLLVVFLYGSMIWYVLPVQEGVSWEGHLSGLITGLIFALFFKKAIAKPKQFAWEREDYNEDDDTFLKHFDTDGNFIEHKIIEDLEEDESVKSLEQQQHRPKIEYRYVFKAHKDEDDEEEVAN